MGGSSLALNESLSCYWSLQRSEDPQVKDRDWRIMLNGISYIHIATSND
jgi:hypothetical protein